MLPKTKLRFRESGHEWRAYFVIKQYSLALWVTFLFPSFSLSLVSVENRISWLQPVHITIIPSQWIFMPCGAMWTASIMWHIVYSNTISSIIKMHTPNKASTRQMSTIVRNDQWTHKQNEHNRIIFCIHAFILATHRKSYRQRRWRMQELSDEYYQRNRLMDAFPIPSNITQRKENCAGFFNEIIRFLLHGFYAMTIDSPRGGTREYTHTQRIWVQKKDKTLHHMKRESIATTELLQLI